MSSGIFKDIKTANIRAIFCTKNIDGTHKYITKDKRGAESANVIKDNHAKVLKSLEIDVPKINVIKQIHGNKVIIIDSDIEFDSEPEIDALVTNTPDLLLGIQTADCVPVLFYDKDNKIIGAAHAGWRGAFSGILQNTIAAMRSLGAENISVLIGPCIKQMSYEIDKIFYSKFIDQDPSNREFFVPGDRADHYLFDLPSYVKSILAQLMINDVIDIDVNTYTDKENCFSFRRFTHDNTNKMGNLLSLIMIEK